MSDPPTPKRRRKGLMIAVGVLAVLSGLAAEIWWTAPLRGATRTYWDLIGAANSSDLDAARRLCSARYLRTHDLTAAPEGGIVGLPRNIHKNHQVWRHGDAVWLCPTNRVGPVYQFVYEDHSWRFDGPVGILDPDQHLTPLPDTGPAPATEE
jgi:hypothetical protein